MWEPGLIRGSPDSHSGCDGPVASQRGAGKVSPGVDWGARAGMGKDSGRENSSANVHCRDYGML